MLQKPIGPLYFQRNLKVLRRAWLAFLDRVGDVNSLRLFVLAALCLAGCIDQPVSVKPLPAPSPEVPVCNLPAELHQRNKLGPKGQGSCVHASTVNHLRWLNKYDLAARWWETYGDGETASGIRSKLDAAKADFVYTENADPTFLDWASRTRRGAIIWWKASHCCTFEGFVKDENGREFAAILDNNNPGRFEYTEREQFIRGWAGFGGFALTVLEDPPSPLPWLSYEVQ